MFKPKAYEGVDLDIHLARVGEVVALVGKDLVSVQTPVSKKIDSFTNVKNSLLISSILAGVFHDIGKASNYYYRKELKSFHLHEFISGIILHNIAVLFLKKERDNLSCIFNLSAWSATRHHVAMIGRHPKSLLIDDNKKMKKISEVLKQFVQNIEFAKEGLPDIIKGSKLYREILNSWSELTKINHINIANKINALANIIAQNSPIYCKLEKDYWISSVEIVTGPVIIADILVSSMEGRESDDNTSRVYVQSWIKELGIRNELNDLMRKQTTLKNLEDTISKIEELL